MTSRPFKTPPLARALIRGAPESRRPEPALSGGQERAARVMGLLVSLRLRVNRRLGSPLHETPWPVIQYGHGDLSPVWLLLAGRPVFIRRPSILSGHHRLLQGGFMHFSLPFRVTFQLSLTLLMRYRSWGVFRLRGWYPRYSDAQTRAPYSGTLLSWRPAVTPTGVSPSLPGHSRTVRLCRDALERARTPHPLPFSGQVRFGLFPVRSPLLRESLLFSFPALTRMFRFGAFPFTSFTTGERCSLLGCNMKSHSGIGG